MRFRSKRKVITPFRLRVPLSVRYKEYFSKFKSRHWIVAGGVFMFGFGLHRYWQNHQSAYIPSQSRFEYARNYIFSIQAKIIQAFSGFPERISKADRPPFFDKQSLAELRKIIDHTIQNNTYTKHIFDFIKEPYRYGNLSPESTSNPYLYYPMNVNIESSFALTMFKVSFIVWQIMMDPLKGRLYDLQNCTFLLYAKAYALTEGVRFVFKIPFWTLYSLIEENPEETLSLNDASGHFHSRSSSFGEQISDQAISLKGASSTEQELQADPSQPLRSTSVEPKLSSTADRLHNQPHQNSPSPSNQISLTIINSFFPSLSRLFYQLKYVGLSRTLHRPFEEEQVVKNAIGLFQRSFGGHFVISRILDILLASIKDPTFVTESKTLGILLVEDAVNDLIIQQEFTELFARLFQTEPIQTSSAKLVKDLFQRPDVQNNLISLFTRVFQDPRMIQDITGCLLKSGFSAFANNSSLNVLIKSDSRTSSNASGQSKKATNTNSPQSTKTSTMQDIDSTGDNKKNSSQRNN